MARTCLILIFSLTLIGIIEDSNLPDVVISASDKTDSSVFYAVCLNFYLFICAYALNSMHCTVLGSAIRTAAIPSLIHVASSLSGIEHEVTTLQRPVHLTVMRDSGHLTRLCSLHAVWQYDCTSLASSIERLLTVMQCLCCLRSVVASTAVFDANSNVTLTCQASSRYL